MKFKQAKLLILAVGLVGGLFIADQFLSKKRTIASFEGGATLGDTDPAFYDLTGFSEKDFYKGFKKALVSGLYVTRAEGAVGLGWGQFLVRNTSGAKVYACEKYPQITVTLKAEGVAYSGEIPTMRIQGPCLSSDDGKTIRPLMVPLKDLHRQLRENNIFRISHGSAGDFATIQALYLYDEWPQYWSVVEVRLSNETQSLIMDGFEMISLLDRVPTLDFTESQ